ncbi:uncharacterized protein LOC126780078 isoform X2 [Nymphalis io]|uniref:uncharacterized protein LOC126780078 isoform X2 n=1 Tax=Inachis io TaxID=171585 RepID=UPI002169C51E|nr:uncharacterized protein LOC126780078 isoform X2 [Nymphalis io]
MLFDFQISIYLLFSAYNIQTFNINNEKINKRNRLYNEDKTFEDERILINQFSIHNEREQQNIKDKQRIKNNLDHLEIVRKKTNYPTPIFNYSLQMNTFKPNVFSKMDVSDDLTNGVGENALRRKTFAATLNGIFDENSEIFKELNKQNKLIERIATTLLRDEINRRVGLDELDFQNILDSVEAKRKSTTVSTTTTTSTTEKLTTLLTLIDETEVRNALKNDPFVKRILKLAHKKKLEYLERMGYG